MNSFSFINGSASEYRELTGSGKWFILKDVFSGVAINKSVVFTPGLLL